MRRGLFESVPLGPQACNEAAMFNANIGAWNTASMTTMATVVAAIKIEWNRSSKVLGWAINVATVNAAR